MAMPKHPKQRFTSPFTKLTILVLLGFLVIALWFFSNQSRLVRPPDLAVINADSKSGGDGESIGDERIDQDVRVNAGEDDKGGQEQEQTSQEEVTPEQDLKDAKAGDTTPEQDVKDDKSEESDAVDNDEQGSSDVRDDQVEEVKELGGPETVPVDKTSTETVPLDKTSTTADGSAISWRLCTMKGAQDYIPCLDNEEAIKMLPSRGHFEHRERHCPTHDDLIKCLVPFPQGYKKPVPWPKSRDEIWFSNVPHPGLVTYKKDQQWVKKEGERLIFPGTGTQFILGARHYINFIEKTLPDVSWGKRTRVVLDVGCGVASFGGYLFEKDVLTMSFAPKDEHEAQVQLALERGIPAISSVMGTQRLVFPANVYDMVHCARCRVPWHENGGTLLLEVNRVLRPGGYFVWSAPPVYRSQADQVQIWKDTSSLAASMCWNQLGRTNDAPSGVGVAIFQKPVDNFCLENKRRTKPALCEDGDTRDAAWYVPMKNCVHKVPTQEAEHGSAWPEEWPGRVDASPKWLDHVSKGIFGKAGNEEFKSDTEHWKHVVQKSYLRGVGLDWRNIRNVMDMKAGYGGFAAALAALPVWVINVVPIHEPDTLPVVFDRGLIGLYHDWCESFSTYPRSYDLLHADHLFTALNKRCKADATLVDMDRILRPEGYAIFRDKIDNLKPLKPLMESLRWKEVTSYRREKEELLVMQKQWWRPNDDGS